MTAAEARKLTFEHSKRMKKIYRDIEQAAKSGGSNVCFNTGEVSIGEIEILRANGYNAVYETAEVDGGQFILVSWNI